MKKFILFFAFAFLISNALAQVVTDSPFSGSNYGTASYVNYGSSFSNYYGSSASTYWPVISNRDECSNSQDIIVQVSPAGCQPAVVRSDLLAEQNVPVFCQLDLLQINPGIDIKQIRNIRFNGKYPTYVAGVGFHPANAALRTTSQLLGTPLQSNIGYVVVVLKRNVNESSMPDFFNFTLSASVDYYSGNSVGIGTTGLLLRQTTDEDWQVAKNKQTFFGGKFSVRLREADTNSVNLELYSGDIKYSSLTLQKNQVQPNAVYLPGSYCQTSLQFSYSDFVAPPAIARLQVDEDLIDVYEGARFLNNRCTVRKVSGDSTHGNVLVNCANQDINLSTSAQLLKIGDKVYKVDDKFNVNRNAEYAITEITKDSKSGKLSYSLNDKTSADSDHVRPVSQTELYDATYGEFESYIVNATIQYELLADSYGNEKKNDFAQSYGEVALSKAIRLSLKYEKRNTAVRLIDKYLQLYPNGKDSSEFVHNLNTLYTRDTTASATSVETEDGFHLIKLIDVTGPAKRSSAKISWGNQQAVINQGDNSSYAFGKLTLTNVKDSETVTVDTACNPGVRGSVYKGDVRLTDSTISACGGTIRVSNIDFANYVQLRISPVTRSSTIGNFTVGVGIEKRAIELTPSKAKKKIENLNKTIKKWESISNNLGDVVRGLKGACFATAGVLTVKNFFTGLSGEALARRDLMSGENGVTKFCQNQVNIGNFSSLTECYNANSENIKEDLDARTRAIKNTSDTTTEIEKNTRYPNKEGIFAGQSFDDVEARKQLIYRIKQSDCSDQALGPLSGNKSRSTVGSLLPSTPTISNAQAQTYSYTQLRDIYFNCQAIKNGGSGQGRLQAQTQLDNIGSTIADRLKYEETVGSYNGFNVFSLNKGPRGEYYGDTIASLNEKDLTGIPSGIDVSTPAEVVAGKGAATYLVTFTKTETGYVPKEVYKLNGKNVMSGGVSAISTSNLPEDLKGELPAVFDLTTAANYNNQFAPGESEVRYFETEPYKGFPAVVPFDMNKGFYAATTQSLPILGQTKSFESNGKPASFWVCNIMANKRVDFYAPNFADDQCVQFNMYTGQPFTSFPGLSESDTKKLVSDAIKALEEASQQYGKKTVRIRGNTLNVGRAASLIPGTQCQDFMSSSDCKLLFNVCDPVICPASRCNFGGAYYVSDVIQSGIVGSALLCLPNVKEGIVMPVCLTGLKAGIDGYLSILKSHQACLQESIDTGKYVGICDQINSVYLCEFFWRQAAPLAKAALPKLVEYAYTGGQSNVRGGGEYLTVASSWQNAEDSVSYFTQSYAVNSIEAFKIRNVEEAGTEICRAFISAKGPKTFESLVEPDSPPQFHAWYSSIDYTDATVPATSQYKVFYHIFAGNDRGVSYSVYLKDPPTDPQYSTNPIVVVATGFAARGQYATESKDFTAPKGYKQLCVRINDKEECGFKQVSSSFALDYVKDSIVNDQLTKTDVTTESQCVSGSVSPAALLNPNLGSIADEAIDPAIYNRGIVRICATDNPGSTTDPTRFAKVGICGESRIGCWLDKKSVSNALSSENTIMRNQTLSEIEATQKANFNQNNKFESSPDIQNQLRPLQDKVLKADKSTLTAVLTTLDELMTKAFWNYDKAEILFWKAQAWESAFENSHKKGEASNVAVGAKPTPITPTTPPVASKPAQGTGSEIGPNRLDGLKLEKDYNAEEEIYFNLNGKKTDVYIKRGNILIEDYTFWFDDIIGSIDRNTNLIKLNPDYAAPINERFWAGAFEKINNSLITSFNPGSGVGGQRILSFNQTYDRGERRDIFLDGVSTQIYLRGSGIFLEGNSDPIGSVSEQGKIRFLGTSRDLINRKFGGEGMYEFLNNRLWVTNIEGRCDLDVLAVVKGVVIVSCVKVPNCNTETECANLQGGNEEDYSCEEGMCYPRDRQS